MWASRKVSDSKTFHGWYDTSPQLLFVCWCCAVDGLCVDENRVYYIIVHVPWPKDAVLDVSCGDFASNTSTCQRAIAVSTIELGLLSLEGGRCSILRF